MSRRRWIAAALALWAGAALVPAAGSGAAGASVTRSGSIEIVDPYMPVPTSSEGAVYMTIRNSGSRAVTLVGATSNVSYYAMLHKEVLHGQSEAMFPVPRLVVPAHGARVLAPGGYHVMLMALTRTLAVGQTATVHLRFSPGPIVTVTVPVVSLARAFGR